MTDDTEPPDEPPDDPPRFDIKQMFAEGFDPDKIAVAFTNDLAGLRARRIGRGRGPRVQQWMRRRLSRFRELLID